MRAAAPARITEEQFLQQVRGLAKVLGWAPFHTRFSKGSDAGWPDLAMINPRQGRIVFAELKKHDGTVTEAQRECLAMLSAVGAEATVWRPCDLEPVIKPILRGRRIPTQRAAEEFH